MMKTFGQILAQCRKECNMTQKQVAEMLLKEHGLAVKVASLSQWEKDQHLPNVKQFFALCRIYQISEIGRVFGVTSPQDPISHLNEEGKQKVYEYASLLWHSGLYEPVQAQVVPFRRKIKKFYLAASAGTGQYIDSDAYETIEVGGEVSSLADFGITIAGNSMEPQFVNGQTVWVHSQESLNAGEIGIFLYEGQAYCKKYMEQDGQVFLISLNPSYEPIPVNEDNGFHIFGKVVG